AIYEENLNSVNVIYLNTIAEGKLTLSEEEEQQLLSIANQCPTEGGDAVFTARDLLEMTFLEKYKFDGHDFCQEMPIDGRQEAVKPTGFNIYPNPTSDVLTIEYPVSSNIRQFIIYDIYGKVIEQEAIETNSRNMTIKLTNMVNGIYYCKIYDGTTALYTQKLIIIE
ncbi:MAG: hypothetical protein RLZZ292_568, partial [Bacteroidota bacterium]